MKICSGESKTSLLEQTASLIKVFSQEDRQDILRKAKISIIEITPEEMVALKADMGIPWEKLKTMSRMLHQIINNY